MNRKRIDSIKHSIRSVLVEYVVWEGFDVYGCSDRIGRIGGGVRRAADEAD